MKHDLVEVLRNPVGFMAEKGKHMLADLVAIVGSMDIVFGEIDR